MSGGNPTDNYRRHKRGRKPKGAAFVQLHHYVLDSRAWYLASPIAKCAYVELMRRYTGVNNGLIRCSVRELAERLNCVINTASKALLELVELGFIDNVRPGAFGQQQRFASEYRLTNFRDDRTGELPSKKFDPNTRWDKQRRSQKLIQQVSKIETDGEAKPVSVSKTDTFKRVSAPAIVSNSETLSNLHHVGLATPQPRQAHMVVERPSALATEVLQSKIAARLGNGDIARGYMIISDMPAAELERLTEQERRAELAARLSRAS
jgi:hypothetical protein